MRQEHSEPKVDGTTDRYDYESRKSPATSIAPAAGKRLFGHVRMNNRQVRRAAACVEDNGAVLFDRRSK